MYKSTQYWLISLDFSYKNKLSIIMLSVLIFETFKKDIFELISSVFNL